MSTPSRIAADTWKAQQQVVTVHWPQIAPLRPDRGVVFTNETGRNRPYAWNPQTGAKRLLLPDDVPCGYGWLSPDGAYYTFFRDTGGNERGQVVRADYETGDLVRLTPEWPDYASSTTPFPLPVLTQSATGNRIAFVTSAPGTFTLTAVDVAMDGGLGEPRILRTGPALLRAPVLSADGTIAAVCTNERTGKQQYDLVAMDHSGAEIGRLSAGETASLEAIAFCPIPGDTRLLCTSDAPGYKRPTVWDVATGEAQELSGSGMPEGELVPLCWSPDAWSVLLVQFVDAQQRLFLYDTAMRRYEPVAHPDGAFAHFGGYGTSLASDGTASVLYTNAQTPTRAVSIAPNGTMTTVLSGGDAPPSCAVRSVTFPSSDGATVQGWLATPEDDGPFPTVIQIHGGPHGVTTLSYGLGASYVGNGFAFLSVNFRGSTTFGREFLQKIWGDVGHWELEDIIAAREFLVREGIADPAKVALTGGSYGGYLTLLGLGKRPDLFATGVAQVALADNALAYEDASPLLQGIMRASFRGTPAEKPDLYRESSPITYAESFRAPVLVIQGKNDTRCPPRQMEVFEARMRALGKPIEVLWFDAGHGFANAAQSAHFTQVSLEFLKKHLG